MTAPHDDVLVGIDLGTTYSLVAILRGSTPELIPNALGTYLTPSMVSIDDDGSILVGHAASARAETHPTRTARAFKRDMGSSRKITLEGHAPLGAEQLSAYVLLALKQDAEAFLGRPVGRAVITVPAYFGDLQRQATRDAAAIAGLDVVRVINEPTAAALAYGLGTKDASMRAVVLDLGGGTFDVTVLEIDDGVIEIRASAGDARLGGEDFTEALAALLARRIGERHGAVAERAHTSHARIRAAAEAAKKQLCAAERARVSLPSLELGGSAVDVDVELTRGEFVEAVEPLMARLRAPILRALRDARMLPTAIDEVLLVGGATRMPILTDLAKSVFQRDPQASLPPDEAVALGAAVQAGLHTGAAAVEDLVVTDIAPFTLGISASAEHHGVQVAGLFTPILDRGTVIPASRVATFHTLADNQTEILVEVFQGEHSLCADNTKLGSVRVTGIPKAPRGEGCIDVRFTYDLSGILEVDVTVRGSNKHHQLVIERNPGQLTRAQVEQARKAMARLKFHPRDSLPNRTALARAEALFVELRGSDRQALAQWVTGFRMALEAQEPAEIERTRFALVEACDALRLR